MRASSKSIASINKKLCFRSINRNVNFSGRYPNCVCENTHHIYDKSNKQCNIPCENGINSYPNCGCVNPLKEYVDKTTGKCVPYARAGRPCPPAAIGISPDCHCLQEGYYFIPYGWGCFNKHFVGFIDWIGCTGPFCDDLYEQGIDPKLLLSLVGWAFNPIFRFYAFVCNEGLHLFVNLFIFREKIEIVAF